MVQSRPMPRRRRRWPLLVLALLVLAAGWIGFWYYAADLAGRTIDGWRVREAQSGRVYRCGSQAIRGFPFNFALECAGTGIAVNAHEPPLSVQAKGLRVTAALFAPTALTAEFVGPLDVAEPGGTVNLAANWRHAEVELHGLPVSPERIVFRIEAPAAWTVPAGADLFKAQQLDVDGRLISGSVQDHPVIEAVLKLAAATAPLWHPAAANPTDAEVTAVLRGLEDFSPKPWPERLRRMQAAGGRIEIKRARLQQGETIAVADGTLGLTPAGRLDGELHLTVANLEKFLPALGLDRMLAQDRASPQLKNAFSALDRIIPGLGNVAKQNAGPALVAGLNLMGQPAELEGKRAVKLPLRFTDGAVSLGPLLIGSTPPLF